MRRIGCINYTEICDENGSCKQECVNSGCIKEEKRCTDSEASKGKLKLGVTTKVSYKKQHTVFENILKQKSSGSSIDKYDEQNRYNYVITKIENEEKKEEKESYFSSADVALAMDVIAAYYSNKIGLLGGATASDFAQVGTLNQSIVSYAEQFKGKRLAQMKMIDDKNIFFDNHWCAMFVSFCMKKAGVDIPVFYGCSSFWTKYRDYVGFFDVAGDTNHDGYRTKNNEHIAELGFESPGDILLFRWFDGSNAARHHTGICQSEEKDAAGNVTKITVIEGNTGGKGYWNSKVSIREYTGESIKQIVSFVSVATVTANGGW